jgi:hypothetical protein
MTRAVCALAAVLLLAAGEALAASIPKEAGPPGPAWATPAFAADKLWDDGKAEFSVYRGTIERYGVTRPVTAKIIAVKEDMNDAQHVKSDRGPVAGRTTTVLKLNYLHDFETGMYAYHQMTSTFLDRSTMQLRKLAMSSTEGCGVTYVEILPMASGWRHVSHSYFDGEGDRDVVIAPLAGRPAVAWDGLALWLRALDLTIPQRFEIALLPSQLASRARNAAFVRATVVITPATAAGVTARVSYTDRDGKPRVDTFVFAAAAPHVLTHLERGDGLTLDLVKTQRIAYWEKTRPGDEKLLEP